MSDEAAVTHWAHQANGAWLDFLNSGDVGALAEAISAAVAYQQAVALAPTGDQR